MKTKYLFLFVFFAVLACFTGQAQNWTGNYVNSAVWNFVPLTPPANNKITVGGGVCSIIALPGYPRDIRIHQPLGATIYDMWTMHFDWMVTNVGSVGGAVIPLVVTAGTQAPCNPDNQPTQQTNQDAIGVLCLTTHFQTAPIWLTPFVKDGNILDTTSCKLTIVANRLYHVTLNRYSPTKGELIVTDESGRLQKCCFDIPETVKGLNTVQTANLVQADQSRSITATLSRSSINTDIDPCCFPVGIKGPESICNPIGSDTFRIVPPIIENYPYTWTFPHGVIFTNIEGTNGAVVTNWGDNSGTITVKVEWYCHCEKNTITATFTVSQNLSLDQYKDFIIDVKSQCPYIDQVTCKKLVDPLPAGAHEKWEIFRSVNCDPHDTSCIQPSLRPPDFSSMYIVVSPDPPYPNLYCDTCYTVKHSVWYDTICPPVVKYRKFFEGSKAGVTPLKSSPGNEGNEKLENGSLGEKIRIYPNPAGSSLNIESIDANSILSYITLSDPSGKEIRSVKVPNGKTMVINLDDLNPGAYTVTFYSKEGKVATKQFIKK